MFDCSTKELHAAPLYIDNLLHYTTLVLFLLYYNNKCTTTNNYLRMYCFCYWTISTSVLLIEYFYYYTYSTSTLVLFLCYYYDNKNCTACHTSITVLLKLLCYFYCSSAALQTVPYLLLPNKPHSKKFIFKVQGKNNLYQVLNHLDRCKFRTYDSTQSC